MAKRKRLPKQKHAAIIREAISDGRIDAAHWGKPTLDGVEAPRWEANRWRMYRGSGPIWAAELYRAAYGQTHRKELRRRWDSLPRADFRKADEVSAQNLRLRYESRDQREQRVLREKVESLERKLSDAGERSLT